MYIIFGDSLNQLTDNFTVLELDTVKYETNQPPVTAYCVIEKVPLQEFPILDANKKLHQDLMQHYRQQHWDYCEQVIAKLLGQWAGELDSFYMNLAERIKHCRTVTLPAGWDGVIDKTTSESTPDTV